LVGVALTECERAVIFALTSDGSNSRRMVIQKENALLKIERVTGDKAIEEAHL
jgi:hypothetical protein